MKRACGSILFDGSLEKAVARLIRIVADGYDDFFAEVQS
jgi:hypothetical protein